VGKVIFGVGIRLQQLNTLSCCGGLKAAINLERFNGAAFSRSVSKQHKSQFSAG
jgi:hypothetical protein